ncbi:TIGR02221 family CRISPR-associated protein [Thermoanaerobacterium sp. CMT5567-10]|uniref:TIGR02221 family CRISPR-associated protein n=1 Tax=Thermoanaerobacterium sp. CMT5567-10 TaxID=3061989 RepID=UPI0026DF11FB|nr:TIGR02221 family CRISPR-associated protein [Thermoanaerobacterium sp. CMT5567-10]WKV07484.1 TIGR02221 family CRISPR-associated protein [Thermoanaerobacterium sp. CMT5567-10]
MATKFFSFLGTGKYAECNYSLDGIKIDAICYVQEALIDIFLKKGIKIDGIYIFKTKEATTANWLSNAKHPEKSGLSGVLKKYEGIVNTIEAVDIPSGEIEEELWDIFDKVLGKINYKDEIIFDITHSFRSLPVLALIILNYAKFVKKCEIKGMYYGAIEALGVPSNEIEKKLKLEDRNAPIFNLTPFVNLLDWTVGIDRFIEDGDSRYINKLIEHGKNELFKKGMKDDKDILEKLGKSIKKYTNNLAVCRGKSISDDGIELKENVNNALNISEESYIKPMTPLIENIKNHFDNFTDDEDKNMIQVVKWCRDHNMIQQGLTILEEGIITYFCNKFGVDKYNKEIRTAIGQAFYIKIKNAPKDEWKDEARLHEDIVNKILDREDSEKLAKLIYDIKNVRNDINHAGWRNNSMSYDTFVKKLNAFIDDVEKIIE